MPPKKRIKLDSLAKEQTLNHVIHAFLPEEKEHLAKHLLHWYDNNQRNLQWRRHKNDIEINIKTYAVLVSEIMLQQTKVITVEKYYKKWMEKWPSLADLANATLEEVNETWAGLGYYSRARRLHELAKIVLSEYNGNLPTNSESLLKLPGIGNYTSAAVASICFNEKTAAVDGNVIRVITRLRFIGGDITTQGVQKEINKLANEIIDNDRPGDFNQAMMELGATICTPKNPKCPSCPINKYCLAYKKNLGEMDIEQIEDCISCFPKDQRWNKSLGVMNFPTKLKKTKVRDETTFVNIIYNGIKNNMKFLIFKRPSNGLLGNLWEFPSFINKSHEKTDEWEYNLEELSCNHNILKDDLKNNLYLGSIKHIFSHINQCYIVYAIKFAKQTEVELSTKYTQMQWVKEEELMKAAISTGMKKIFTLFKSKINSNSILKQTTLKLIKKNNNK